MRGGKGRGGEWEGKGEGEGEKRRRYACQYKSHVCIMKIKMDYRLQGYW